jgi:PKD repeat protein
MDWTATPTQVAGIGGAVAVSAGQAHSVVALGDGSVWAWGANAVGQLGDGTTVDSVIPVQAAGLTNVTALASLSANFNLALRGDGTVWAWGVNGRGQLGDGTTINRPKPVQVLGLTGIVRIAVAGGWKSSYALGADGTLWSWGDNQRGQLGYGTASTDPYPVPAPIAALSHVTTVSAGDTHVIAQTADGKVWTWGINFAGQLGLGDFADRWLPTEVVGLSGVVGVFAGGDSTAVLATCELGCSANVPVTGAPGVALPFSAATTTTSGCEASPTFDWDFGDGSAHSSEQDPSHAYALEGTYHWVLTVTLDDQSCTSEGDITITYPCTVSCSAAAPAYVQVGTAAAFTSSATLSHCAGAASYHWDFGDGSAHSAEQSPAHAYAAPGVYTWTLTVTANGASCVRTGQITVLGPACTGAYNLIIPAAAHSNNAWQSDLDLYNVGTDPASVDIALLKPGQANFSPSAMNVAVLPGIPLRIPDILGAMLPAANAALGVRFCSGSALVNSRFYNIGTAKTGTFGAIVPALPPSAAVTPTTRGVFHHLTYSPDPKAGYRVNLGFANASPFSVSVTVRLYGDNGALLGTKTLSVRAFEQSRLDKIHQTLGTGPVAHGAMTVEVNTPNALLHAYALLIDNVSNDPAFMPVELVPR